MTDKTESTASPTSEGREEFAGHTPGPWYADCPRGVTWRIRQWATGHYVFESNHHGARGEANARLIAAAPDLLRENAELRATLAQKDEEIARLKGLCASALRDVDMGIHLEPVAGTDPDGWLYSALDTLRKADGAHNDGTAADSTPVGSRDAQ